MTTQEAIAPAQTAPIPFRQGMIGWNHLSLGRKLVWLFLGTILPVLVAAVLLGFQTYKLSQAIAERDRLRAVLSGLNALKLAVLNVETSGRSFALTADRAFLEPYEQGLKDAEASLAQLRGTASERANLGALDAVRIDALDAATGAFLNARANALNEDRSSLTPEARVARAVGDMNRYDALRAQFTDLQTALTARFEATIQAGRDALRAQIILGLSVLGVFGLAGFVIFRGLQNVVVNRVQALHAAATALEGGDYTIQIFDSGGTDEIAQLERTFNSAARMLEDRTRELERSNRELEQFAYVASHDLQEPLRMVSSYTQLLARRYAGKLDEKADTYIRFAVDGATRMQNLIEDLLAFSRIATRPPTPQEVNTENVARQVAAELGLALEESGGSIEIAPLPTVLADRSQVVQVFSNLMGNALKFRRPGVPPRVEVSARPEAAFWQFSVADNGIGLEPEYFDRVFVIFQRLHTRDQYPGSGIGLAIVKRIVERQGGRIWLESTPGSGTTVHFTLPAASPSAVPQAASVEV